MITLAKPIAMVSSTVTLPNPLTSSTLPPSCLRMIKVTEQEFNRPLKYWSTDTPPWLSQATRQMIFCMASKESVQETFPWHKTQGSLTNDVVSKSVPKGLKLLECKLGIGGKNLPICYIPELDPVQEALKKKKKTTYLKLTLPSTKSKLSVARGCQGLLSCFCCMSEWQFMHAS